MIQFRGRSILFDCVWDPPWEERAGLAATAGRHPGREAGLRADHPLPLGPLRCAAVPDNADDPERSQPKIFMTQPTRTLYEYVTKDFIRKAMRGNFGAAAAARSGIDLSSTEAFGNESGSIGSQLYEEADIDRTNALIEVIGFDETKESRGIRITCLNTGHDGVHVPG